MASNIIMASPPDDMSKISLNSNPISNPKAPKISKMIIRSPNFSRLKRLNSFFILGEMKYEIEYAIKERLENKTQEINK